MRLFAILAGLLIVSMLCAHGDEVRIAGLSAPVEVYRDQYDIPHVYAASWTDAARVLGYLHASERLTQMEMFRRQASGQMAEILGESQLKDDIAMRQLGIRRSCEAAWNSDVVPQSMKDELIAYSEGVNQRVSEMGADGLPPFFKEAGFVPAPWTPVDSLTFSKYMGWDQGGTDSDLWFGMMVEKLGAEAVASLWPLERPYEIPAVLEQADGSAVRTAALEAVPGASDAYAAAMEAMAPALTEKGIAFGSNNWAVAGSKTASGKPMLCSDPHLGFKLPSLWYSAHISVDGFNVAGCLFPTSPFVIIGHNDRLGWGITNMQADAVDYYVETVDPADPLKYQHMGEWKTMVRVTESIPVKGQEPKQVDLDYTVHGPVISREGRVISLAWTGLGVTNDAGALYTMNRATNLKEWLAGCDMMDVPALNLVYADADGTIALHPCGKLPVRLPGEGRIPMDGSTGAHDWKAFIPRDELPLAVNPESGFVASANARPAPIGFPHYLGWMWDSNHRERRIYELLEAASGLTVETMKAIQTDARDKSADVNLPLFLRVMQARVPEDAFAVRVLAAVSQWDHVADADAIGPIIWMRWFDAYRSAVWDDEWTSRGIEQPGGSWGFSGNNRREPMLEVLEYMTLEMPESVWFDDRTTPAREMRDEIIAKSFGAAVESLTKDFGNDLTEWAWRNINVLKIGGLLPIPGLEREAGPVPGTRFTVNPGSGGGAVSGGASYRLIVDFGEPAQSVGVYPGGQSEDPGSAHYSDLMPVWAAQQYVPIQAVSDPEMLTADAKTGRATYLPMP
ncbi:MAG: penicillin amidase [Candidatus Hydrogenedentota bacterium]